MHGFSILISLNENLGEHKFIWKAPFGFQQELVLRTYSAEKIIVEQYTGKKFLNEKLWIDNDDFLIVSDGVITNLEALCKQYNTENYEELLKILTKEKDFFKYFKGHFVGFIHYKKTNKSYAFNNHSGSKKLFYFHNNKIIVFSTDLFTLSKVLDSYSISKSLDIEASYLLLTSGFMHENYTLISEVKQLRAGEYAQYNDKNFNVKSYFHLSDISQSTDDRLTAINKLEKIFQQAIKLEFDIDKNSKLKSLTTLSGGLDSRMVALLASKLSYSQEFLCFSEKEYADEVIAHEIASDYKIPIHFIPLSASGLCSIDEVVAVNDGLTLYTGAGHVFEALKQLNIENTGMIHTGMIGDAVLGSFVTSKRPAKPRLIDGLYSRGLFPKVAGILEKHISEYETEELYKYYNRAFLGANNGFLFFDLVGEPSSPFLEPDFLTYAYSMPESYKLKENLYIDWIKSKHPDFTNYIWETIGCKPTNNKMTRLIARLNRAIVKRLPIKSMWENTMTPEQQWYDNNPEIKKYLDSYFSEHIHLISFEKELFNDCNMLYCNGNITEKAQVLTLLAAYKLLF